MLSPLRTVLFATDLTPSCQNALEFAVAQATRFEATIVLLHVIESLPDTVEGRLKGQFGKHKWQDIVHSQESNVQQTLTGKISANAKIKQEIQQFCQNAGIDLLQCQLPTPEILIAHGNIGEKIVESAEELGCDLIVLGAKKGVFSNILTGSTLKAVFSQARVPVTIVPSVSRESKK